MSAILLTNARLVGHESDDLYSVLLEDGKVTQISSSAIKPSSEHESIDCKGFWLSPSFVDHHVHFSQWAQTLKRLDLTVATSAAAVCDIVKAKAEA